MIAILVVLTALSRLTHISVAGVGLVVSESMEPSLRVFDLVLYVGDKPSIGDVVLWGTSPSICVIHRLVKFDDRYIVTKGDANPIEDPPAPWNAYKGRVLLTLPRELWLPSLLLLSVSLILRGLRSMDPLSASFLTMVSLLALIWSSVLVQAGSLSDVSNGPTPRLYLSSIRVASSNCSVTLEYTGDMELLEAEVYASTSGFCEFKVNARVVCNKITLSLPLDFFSKSFEEGVPVKLKVKANLTRLGRLTGEYEVRVPGEKPRFYVENGSLVIVNSNGFPLSLNVTFLYAYKIGEPWKRDSKVLSIGGLEKIVLNPPEAKYVYAELRYKVYGSQRFERLMVRG